MLHSVLTGNCNHPHPKQGTHEISGSHSKCMAGPGSRAARPLSPSMHCDFVIFQAASYLNTQPHGCLLHTIARPEAARGRGFLFCAARTCALVGNRYCSNFVPVCCAILNQLIHVLFHKSGQALRFSRLVLVNFNLILLMTFSFSGAVQSSSPNHFTVCKPGSQWLCQAARIP